MVHALKNTEIYEWLLSTVYDHKSSLKVRFDKKKNFN